MKKSSVEIFVHDHHRIRKAAVVKGYNDSDKTSAKITVGSRSSSKQWQQAVAVDKTVDR